MGKLVLKGIVKDNTVQLDELKAGYEKTIKDLREKIVKLEKENATLKKNSKKEDK